MSSKSTVESHLSGKAPIVQAIYDRLLAELREFGPVQEAPQKTSINLDHTVSFAGVYARKTYINLRFRLRRNLEHPRIVKSEQLAARQFMLTVRLEDEADLDGEVLGWLKEAYNLAG
ncbi:MAG: hypothetical protein JW910_16775 [Anaerolineae bacterium]|nr:hypothetical protein [Anaerolineae bacterium]